MSERRSLLGDLSWFQVVAGALAAMTSAWIASTLGVAGTIIGAAIGSLVVTISSAVYARTLDKGRILVVKTDSGTTIQQRVEPDEVTTAMEQIVEEAPTARDPELVPDRAGLNWKAIIATTVAVLVLAFLAMGAYELVSDRAYGTDPDNPRIGNPFGSGTGTDTSDEEPAETPEPSATPSEPEPTATTPAPTATTPTPAPTATTPAPTRTPTPTPTAPAP